MAYDLWNTCMLVPGLKSAECASWVQAIGSIAAILVAVAVAAWQRREDRAREEERDRAGAYRQMDILLSLAEDGLRPIRELPAPDVDDAKLVAFLRSSWGPQSTLERASNAIDRIGPGDVPSGVALQYALSVRQLLKRSTGMLFNFGARRALPAVALLGDASELVQIPELKVEAETLLARIRVERDRFR
jgi:hypothetical protein